MKSGELKKAKRDIRRRVLVARDALSAAERERRGALIVEGLLALPEVAAAQTVLAFWAFGSEVPTRPLLEALHGRGVRVVLPRIVEGDLELRSYEPGDPVTGTAFGAMEPTDGAVAPPIEIDVVCTPAVAFDRRGARVGYGGGYYDRLFARTRADALRVGMAFALQVLDEELPRGHFDQLVDAVVTEAGTIRCERAG